MPARALQLFETSPDSPRLIGIAKLASEGAALSEGHNVEYLTIGTRSILNRCTARNMPFTWTVNPYRGCEFACKYCYARYTHEYMELRDPLSFERQIYVKQHVAEQTRRDLKRVKRGEQIAIGTATDPYQPAERRFRATRSILEVLAECRGLDIGMITKSTLVLRDAELLREIAAHSDLSVTLTVTTLNSDLARILEPRAPRPDLRLDTIRQLSLLGIRAGVSCAPVIPGITDSPRDLDALIGAAREAGASFLFANPLNLRPCSAAVFLPFLEKEFPQLVANYRERYGKRAYVEKAYQQRISNLVRALKRKHGLRSRHQEHPAEQEPPLISATHDQMTLF
jgi:DNA repair photolyase